MAKILNGGSLISYGPTLPSLSQTSDGSLFFKTDNADGTPAGLYLFGFIKDTNIGQIGNQVSQNWVQAVSPELFVLKSGDTMTGALTVPSFLRITTTSGAQRLLVGNQDSLGANKPVILEGANGVLTIGTGSTWSGSGGSLTPGLVIDNSSASGLTFRGNVVYHTGYTTGLNADLLDGLDGTDYQNMAHAGKTGVLPAARGGTGLGSITQGGVLYGSGASSFAMTAAGTSGNILKSNGAAAPTWVDTSTITVGSATNADYATAAGSASTATTATTANAVPWTGITGFNATPFNGSASLQTLNNFPASGFTTFVRPSYFYDLGASGSQSMTPPQFLTSSLSGFDSYSTSDVGQYMVGLTVMGTAGTRSFQMAASWNFEETAPAGGLKYRVNDDTGTTSAWGPFTTIWDQGNLTSLSQLTNDTGFVTAAAAAGSYVSKAGDSMTGTLNINGISLNYSNSNIVTTGTVLGNAFSTNGQNSTGYINVVRGDASHSGYIELFSPAGIRGAYIGYISGNPGQDAGTVNYVAGAHSFVNDVSVSGNVYATGNVTAYSDKRIKDDVKRIENAIEKVEALTGITFLNIKTDKYSTGLIAQDVQKVLPEAVEEHDGLLAVAYGNLVGLLVEAIKEQQEQIRKQQDQIDVLVMKLVE